MAASFLVLCSSFLVSYSRNLIIYNNSRPVNWKNALFAILFAVLAFLCHYSSLLISVIIFIFILLLRWSLYSHGNFFKKIVQILVSISLLIGVLYILSNLVNVNPLNSYDLALEKYSNYQNALSTFTFAVESKNAIFIQLLFCTDFIIPIIKNRSYSKFYKSIKPFSEHLAIFLYSLGFIGYGLCYYSIYSPGIQEFGRRIIYYIFTIEILAFSVSITRIRKMSYVLFLTFPFIAYTVVMIFFSENLFIF